MLYHSDQEKALIAYSAYLVKKDKHYRAIENGCIVAGIMLACVFFVQACFGV
jgi:hypothetical protein